MCGRRGGEDERERERQAGEISGTKNRRLNVGLALRIGCVCRLCEMYETYECVCVCANKMFVCVCEEGRAGGSGVVGVKERT